MRQYAKLKAGPHFSSVLYGCHSTPRAAPELAVIEQLPSPPALRAVRKWTLPSRFRIGARGLRTRVAGPQLCILIPTTARTSSADFRECAQLFHSSPYAR